jgi:hypothetical protein
MISQEKEDEIWERVRKFWFYAMLPQAKIVQDPKADDPSITQEAKQELNAEEGAPEFLTYVDKKLYLNMPHIIRDLIIKDDKELEDAVEILELHGTGHYSLIAYDLITKLLLTHNSAKALKSQGIADGYQAQEMGATLSNVLEDIIDNTYILEHGDEKGMPGNKEKICFLYDRVKQRKETDPKQKKEPRKAWDVYMRVNEKLWSEEGRWVDKKKFSEDQERAAERICTLIKDNMYDSRNWEKRVYRFTQILAPFIKEDGKKGKDLQMFESESSGEGKRLKQMLKQLQGMKGKKGKDGKNKPKDGKDNKQKSQEEKDLEKKIKQLEKDVEEKIKGLANRLGKDNRNILQEYKELTVGSGIADSEETANKWLYRDLANNYTVKFRPMHTVAGKAHPFTPKRWNPSDSPQTLDMGYTIQTSGRAIPGVTTSKWKYKETYGFKEGDKPPDLYLILDSSGSMTNPNQQIAPAVLGAMAAAHSAKNVGVKVAVKNFSGEDQGRRDTDTLDETEDIDEIDDALLVYKGGGTVLPQEDLLEWVKRPEDPKQFLLITDTGFHNFDAAFPHMKSMMEMNDKNRGAIFCIGSGYRDYVKQLETTGWEVFYVNSQDDLFDLVIGKAKEVYEGTEEQI